MMKKQELRALVDGLKALAAMQDPDAIDDETLAEVMTAAVRLFAAKCEMPPYPTLIKDEALTATEAATAASELIRAVDMNLFDFAMWHDRVR